MCVATLLLYIGALSSSVVVERDGMEDKVCEGFSFYLAMMMGESVSTTLRVHSKYVKMRIIK